MACNTQPGPAMAIKLIESRLTGVKLTQKDWHLLRETSAAENGGVLSQAIADIETKVLAASALTRSLQCIDKEASEFVAAFSAEKNTVGTCSTLISVATRGVPAEILNRKRRNRGRAAAKRPSSISVPYDDINPVVTQDAILSGVVIDGKSQRIPLYRVTFKGRLIGVSLSREGAMRLAEKYQQNPRQ